MKSCNIFMVCDKNNLLHPFVFSMKIQTEVVEVVKLTIKCKGPSIIFSIFMQVYKEYSFF